ncbi:hypothetical protein G4G28_04000 [Massilia sp. Dwa41.01b]|uniref:DUF6624 domain-containing protein n=1 Tax=Massilia sp. Dwa41.01b TaxID=2709302 RepID=UPI0015FF2DC5|nr:DUF6624 domain-containing protein [Massilia sp. Dwa41.01b]QNA87838.1 hypothetical protein G4G28_04000 [Massilia sp. Dwa41.01b]
MDAAWTLLQHADSSPDFRAALLPTLGERAAAGELRAARLAQFTDRVLVAYGRPQRYGTQFSPEGWRAPHFGLDDAASLRAVEENRRVLGVMPLADYVCMMSEARKR